jgi:hypothetical protein
MEIKITQSQLKHILSEQEDKQPIKYPCVPEDFQIGTEQIIEYWKNPTMAKVVLGIIGRESNFGKYWGTESGPKWISWMFPTKYAVKTPFEYILNSSPWLLKQAKKIMSSEVDNWQPSMGLSQMTPDVAAKYGIPYEELLEATGAMSATFAYIMENYQKAMKYNDTNKPSVVASFSDKSDATSRNTDFKYSTGNAALDLAIASYNAGPTKVIKQWCMPKKDAGVDGFLRVPCSSEKANKDEFVRNYLPNFKQDELTTHGYVKEVSQRMKGYSCIKDGIPE